MYSVSDRWLVAIVLTILGTMAQPVDAQAAQRSSVGVTAATPRADLTPSDTASSAHSSRYLVRSLGVANAEQHPGALGRAGAGAILGALVGVVATSLVVANCERHDDSHGDGPGCGIGYVVVGVPAVVVGSTIGAVVGWTWPARRAR